MFIATISVLVLQLAKSVCLRNVNEINAKTEHEQEDIVKHIRQKFDSSKYDSISDKSQ